jgi:hypothetical protein
MRRIGLILLLTGLLLPATRAAADTVYLRNGRTVEGVIVKARGGELILRTEAGDVTYPQDDVKFFDVVRPDANGTPQTKRLMFKLPPLKLPFEHESRYYLSKSDIAPHVATNAGKAMDQFFKTFQRLFRIDDDEVPQKKTELVIFKDEKGFMEYAESLGANLVRGVVGFYRSTPGGPDMIVTYRRQTQEFHTLSTLYHEGTHQFVMMVMDPKKPPPLWVNEGLAVYFENSQFRNGRLYTGIIPRARLRMLQQALRQDRHIPLTDLMKRTRANYNGLCYAQGWSVIYFLVHAENGAYARRFQNYFRALRRGEDPDAAFTATVTTDIDRLEELWKAWMLQLKLPKS